MIRRNKRIGIHWPWEGGDLAFLMLTPMENRRFEAFLTEWEPGEHRPVAGFGHHTEEWIYILQGQLEIS